MIKQISIAITMFILIACSNVKNEKYSSQKIELVSDVQLENKFEQLTKKAINDSIVAFRLDTLTNFTWDTLVIIKPYFPIDSLEKMAHLNLRWVIGNGSALMNDGENILVFSKNNEIVNFVRLPRVKGDFYTSDSIMILSKNNCNFEFFRTPNKYSDGRSSVDAKIIH